LLLLLLLLCILRASSTFAADRTNATDFVFPGDQSFVTETAVSLVEEVERRSDIKLPVMT
jgi:hypothetical protein